MSIKFLPDIVINKLKAGEIVERPASVIKELIENAIDAHATEISIDIYDGGKELIVIQDNGDGIEYADSEMILERYATSKITSDEDLDNLGSYGFRGEALASIAEVSNITIETKTKFSDIGFQTTKNQQLSETKKVSLPFSHGTKIMIQDLFINTPVRKKFLKSNQTEYFYCYQMCLDFALIRHDIHRIIKKNGKIVHNLTINKDITSRVIQTFKKDRSKQLYSVESNHANIVINGVISDTTLTFGSNEYCKIYVNGRPVQDKSLQKAIMEGYRRQISHGEYPLAIISIDVPSNMVDVNIHPRKLQVKFIDAGAIFSSLKSCIEETLGHNKVFHGSHKNFIQKTEQQRQTTITTTSPNKDFSNNIFGTPVQTVSFQEPIPGKEYTEKSRNIIGQIRKSYIILEEENGIQYIDQHALAERIAFEKMKRDMENGTYGSSTLLHPISIQIQGNQESNN